MSDRQKTLFIILVLAIAVLAVFWRVHRFEFVNYDDDQFVYKNERILSGLTIDNIVWFFTHSHAGHWQPLTAVSHMLDYKLYGLNAGGHHITNLILHVINTLLLFVILRRMTGSPWPSAFVSAAFGLHPMHVESVAWVTERRDVLSALFLILTIAAYFRYTRKPSASRYLFTLLFFALGLMSKPMLVTLPFVLLLLDYWPLERFGKRSLKNMILEKLPLLALTAVSCAITVVVQTKVGTLATVRGLGLYARISNAIVSYVQYVVKTFWPVNLAVFYPHPGDEIPLWQVIGAAAVLVAVTSWLLALSKRHKYLLTGWLWYLGTLVPVIGLVQVGAQSMADRYTYIPSIGFFIAAAWGANELLAEWKYRRFFFGCLSFAVILIFTVLTWFQVGYWRDSLNLFDHSIKVTKENDVSYNNRGTVYYEGGEYANAIADYDKAISLSPAQATAYYNRGKVYTAEGRYDLAISDYSKAIELNPRLSEAYNNRGNAYKNTGRYEPAIVDYSKAIEISPRLAEAYNNRGTAYYEKGQLAAAIFDYNKAIELNPVFAWAYFNKAGACESAGLKKEAVEAYKAFIRYAPQQYATYIERVRQKIKELER